MCVSERERVCCDKSFFIISSSWCPARNGAAKKNIAYALNKNQQLASLRDSFLFESFS